MTTTTTARAALEALDAMLDSAQFATTLLISPGQAPRLSIASRATALTQELCAHDGRYWWPWAEPVCPIGDPQTAATKVAIVLRATPHTARG